MTPNPFAPLSTAVRGWPFPLRIIPLLSQFSTSDIFYTPDVVACPHPSLYIPHSAYALSSSHSYTYCCFPSTMSYPCLSRRIYATLRPPVVRDTSIPLLPITIDG
ncbi:unnamed protein product [Cyclocybe aegerita]|uniref:Uncharacterized protein n=1 Tax=Cyclocybe aegerita TaxID=1973307 RepID=A0A8S0XQL3_CYCAE|nr:unnamed protein product [Cyclocybe aegerita]